MKITQRNVVLCSVSTKASKLKYIHKCHGPAASFLTSVHVEMVIPSRFSLGKHWLRALFTEEIQDVSKQRWTLCYSIEWCGCIQRTHKIIWPWFLSSLKSCPTSHCCAGRRMRQNIQSMAQGFSSWFSPHPVHIDMLCVLCHVTVAHVWYEDKSTSCHLWRMLQVP